MQWSPERPDRLSARASCCWGAIGGFVLTGFALAFEQYVLATVGASVVVIGHFVWWWNQRHDERLIDAGVVIDRSACYREQITKGDRHAKWVALVGIGSMGLIGAIVVVIAIAKVT